jgi:hypothetical protein
MLTWLRPAVRVLLLAVAVASAVAYCYVSSQQVSGDITQVIEVLFIVFMTVEAGMVRPREELAGRQKRPFRV